MLTGAHGASGGAGDLLELIVGGSGSGPSGPATIRELVAAIDATGGYDGVTAKLAGHRFRVFRDPGELVTGRATTHVRVRR